MEYSNKPTRTFKVKKKSGKNPIFSQTLSPRTIKIAKKLSGKVNNFPVPNSIQEDFLLETEQSPLNFLSNASPNPDYELLIIKQRSLSPTDIVGPVNRYQIKPTIGEIPKSVLKHQLTLRRLITRPPTPTLDQKIQERKAKFKEDFEKKMTNMDLVPDRTFNRQTNSLENFKKQVSYWNAIEINMADRLLKNPEELQMNSARIFNAKQREVDIIDRLHKTNEIPERGFWRESLRTETAAEKFYKHTSPEVVKGNNLIDKYKNELLHYTKTPNFGRRQLKGSEYFQEKLKMYDKDKEEILNYVDGEELVVHGINKIKLEFDAVKRVGNKNVVLPPLELFNEQIIEKHYEARVLPVKL